MRMAESPEVGGRKQGSGFNPASRPLQKMQSGAWVFRASMIAANGRGTATPLNTVLPFRMVRAMQAALASLMNVKPITILRGGVLNIAERVRTRKASIARIIEIAEQEFGNMPVYLGVLQANDLPSGQALLEEACKHFNVVGEPVLTELSISVAANLGPGTVGLVLYPVG